MISIENIEDLLSPKILHGNTYVSHSVEFLTAPGDNFGSLMLAVEVTTRDENGQESTLHLVAKKFPPKAELQELFSSPVTFKKEMEMYRTIFPTMIQLQREEGVEKVIEFVPKYYNGFLDKRARNRRFQNGYSETPKVADANDSVLLLENLKVSGYLTCKRTKGFDFEATKSVLEDLAVFHALPVAMKLKRPETFKEKLLPHLKRFYMYDSLDEQMKESAMDTMVRIVRQDIECSCLEERAKAAYLLGSTSKAMKNSEPYATISHNDLWVNNVMMKFENGKPIKNKLLDFQLIDYGSPGKDVVFLIFSSAQEKIIQERYDDLIRLYYDKFISTLQDLNCDTEKFSFEGLQEELTESARTSQFFHLMLMVQVVFGEENNPEPLEVGEPTKGHKARTWFIVKEFAKRNWI